MAVLLLVAVVCLVGAGAARATFAGRDGEILSLDGGFWLSGTHGQASHPFPAPPNLLNNPVSTEDFFTFLPSGRKIAFLISSYPQPLPGLAFLVETVNANGTGARAVIRGKLPTSLVRMSGLAFSPDGRLLAVAYVYGGLPLLTRIVFVNVTTGKVVRSILLRREVDSLVWSADGDLLLVPDQGPLLAMRPNGKGRHRIKIRFPVLRNNGWLVDSTGEDRPVAPSPDGSRLAVSATTARGDDNDVFLVPAAGGKAKPLGGKDDELCCATWSPNGRQVIVGPEGALQLETIASGRKSKLDVPGEVLDWQALPR